MVRVKVGVRVRLGTIGLVYAGVLRLSLEY